ncbi:MAG TPA: chemotaxis protein CheC [Magnetospirillum sp.]|nr:chemotaxis protein CheC [Magnetospirillum sp.]
MTITLSDMERDVVTELFNIGVGQAAAAFGELTREKVQLAVPRVDIVSYEDASSQLAAATGEPMIGIRQDFEGPLTGVAALIFPERSSLEIVRAAIDDRFPLDDVSELERETLLEIGNIILNSCLAAISDMLGMTTAASLPLLVHSAPPDLLDSLSQRTSIDRIVLFLHIDFSVSRLNVSGYLLFILGVEGSERFVQAVRSFMQRSGYC